MSEASVSRGVSETVWKAAPHGARVRVMVSILGGTAWLVFTLLFAAFAPTGFTLFQNIMVVFASILVLGAVLGAMWVSYGMHYPQ